MTGGKRVIGGIHFQRTKEHRDYARRKQFESTLIATENEYHLQTRESRAGDSEKTPYTPRCLSSTAMMSGLQGDAQATVFIIRWHIACRQCIGAKHDATQRLGHDFHRMMAGSSFSCGLPSDRKDFTRHRLVLRKIGKVRGEAKLV